MSDSAQQQPEIIDRCTCGRCVLEKATYGQGYDKAVISVWRDGQGAPPDYTRRVGCLSNQPHRCPDCRDKFLFQAPWIVRIPAEFVVTARTGLVGTDGECLGTQVDTCVLPATATLAQLYEWYEDRPVYAPECARNGSVVVTPAQRIATVSGEGGGDDGN